MARPPALRDVQQVAALRVALRRLTRRTELVARRSGLTPQRYLLLLLIKGSDRGDERATVGELADRMQLAKSTVTELVNRAELAGLVARTSSPTDARVAPIALTPEGERRFAESFQGLTQEREALRMAVEELS